MCARPAQRGATATIVSSDKDLMQLVTDCVTMYDTMKDRRLGIPEVIEKFGVPPEKVVEVQALAGDSVDNVPGVPGIGVKTAAQLITEYGDLETLLARAGEIKQPKRREALIENAEKARISRQLVLLDDKVALDVPLDDLAVHEPDARKLIAFLKAMEFTTLTKRVADYSEVSAAEIEPDRKNASSASSATARPSAGATTGDLFGNDSSVKAAPVSRAKATGDAEIKTPAALAAGSSRSGAQAAGPERQIRNHPHARPAAGLGRPHREQRKFRLRGAGADDRSDAGGIVRHRPRARAERCLLHSRSITSRQAKALACSPPALRRIRSRCATR